MQSREDSSLNVVDIPGNGLDEPSRSAEDDAEKLSMTEPSELPSGSGRLAGDPSGDPDQLLGAGDEAASTSRGMQESDSTTGGSFTAGMAAVDRPPSGSVSGAPVDEASTFSQGDGMSGAFQDVGDQQTDLRARSLSGLDSGVVAEDEEASSQLLAQGDPSGSQDGPAPDASDEQPQADEGDEPADSGAADLLAFLEPDPLPSASEAADAAGGGDGEPEAEAGGREDGGSEAAAVARVEGAAGSLVPGGGLEAAAESSGGDGGDGAAADGAESSDSDGPTSLGELVRQLEELAGVDAEEDGEAGAAAEAAPQGAQGEGGGGVLVADSERLLAEREAPADASPRPASRTSSRQSGGAATGGGDDGVAPRRLSSAAASGSRAGSRSGEYGGEGSGGGTGEDVEARLDRVASSRPSSGTAAENARRPSSSVSSSGGGRASGDYAAKQLLAAVDSSRGRGSDTGAGGPPASSAAASPVRPSSTTSQRSSGAAVVPPLPLDVARQSSSRGSTFEASQRAGSASSSESRPPRPAAAAAPSPSLAAQLSMDASSPARRRLGSAASNRGGSRPGSAARNGVGAAGGGSRPGSAAGLVAVGGGGGSRPGSVAGGSSAGGGSRPGSAAGGADGVAGSRPGSVAGGVGAGGGSRPGSALRGTDAGSGGSRPGSVADGAGADTGGGNSRSTSRQGSIDGRSQDGAGAAAPRQLPPDPAVPDPGAPARSTYNDATSAPSSRRASASSAALVGDSVFAPDADGGRSDAGSRPGSVVYAWRGDSAAGSRPDSAAAVGAAATGTSATDTNTTTAAGPRGVLSSQNSASSFAGAAALAEPADGSRRTAGAAASSSDGLASAMVSAPLLPLLQARSGGSPSGSVAGAAGAGGRAALSQGGGGGVGATSFGSARPPMPSAATSMTDLSTGRQPRSTVSAPAGDAAAAERAAAVHRHLLPTQVQPKGPHDECTVQAASQHVRTVWSTSNICGIRSLPNALSPDFRDRLYEELVRASHREQERKANSSDHKPSLSYGLEGGPLSMPLSVGQKQVARIHPLSGMFTQYEYLPSEYDRVKLTGKFERLKHKLAKTAPEEFVVRAPPQALKGAPAFCEFTYATDPVESYTSSMHADADLARSRVVAGPFYPSGRINYTQVLKGRVDECMMRLCKHLSQDWPESFLQVFEDRHGAIVATFHVGRAVSEGDLSSYMNQLAKQNHTIATYQLLKDATRWGLVDENSQAVFYVMWPPWVRHKYLGPHTLAAPAPSETPNDRPNTRGSSSSEDEESSAVEAGAAGQGPGLGMGGETGEGATTGGAGFGALSGDPYRPASQLRMSPF